MRQGTSRRTVLAVGLSGLLQAWMVPLASLLSLPLVLAQVGVQAYGWWAALAGFAAILGLADGGIRLFVQRSVAERYGCDGTSRAADVREPLFFVVAVGLALVTLTMAVREPLLTFLVPDATGGDAVQLQGLLVCVAALSALSLYNGVLYAQLAGLQRADLAMGTTVAAALTSVTVNVIAAYQGAGVDSFLYGSLAGALISTTGAQLWTRRLARGSRSWLPLPVGPRRLRAILAMSTVILMAGALRVLDVPISRVITSHTLGAEATATMSVITTLAVISVGIAAAPAGSLLTALAELGITERTRSLVTTAADLTAGLAAIAAAGVFICGPGLLQLWLGDTPVGGAAAMRGVALAVVPATAGVVATAVLLARRREPALALVSCGGVMLLVALSVAGGRWLGLPGLAAALAVTQFVAATALLRVGGSLVAPIGQRALRHILVAGPVAAALAWWVGLPTSVSPLGWTATSAVIGVLLGLAQWWAFLPSSRTQMLRIAQGLVARPPRISGSTAPRDSRTPHR